MRRNVADSHQYGLSHADALHGYITAPRQAYRIEIAGISPFRRQNFGLEKILDCKSEQTFLACKIGWADQDREPHAVTLRLYQALLRPRRTEPAISCSGRGSFEALALDDGFPDALGARLFTSSE